MLYKRGDAHNLSSNGGGRFDNFRYTPVLERSYRKNEQLIDRMRPFVANGKLKGKKAVVVKPSAEGEKVCGPMLEMFHLIFQYLGIEFAGKVFAKAYKRKEKSSTIQKI